jgi:hypothetical protein
MNPLLWIFQFAFGCHHGHLSRVFTIKKRTYKVCLDCGEEFGLPEPYHTALSSVAGNARARTYRAADASIV